MSFWSFWNGKKEKKEPATPRPEPLGVIAVLTAGKWEEYVFVRNWVYVEEGRLKFVTPFAGTTCFAPGIWSAFQIFPLSEECQESLREYYRTRVYDSLIEEKIKLGTL